MFSSKRQITHFLREKNIADIDINDIISCSFLGDRSFVMTKKLKVMVCNEDGLKEVVSKEIGLSKYCSKYLNKIDEVIKNSFFVAKLTGFQMCTKINDSYVLYDYKI